MLNKIDSNQTAVGIQYAVGLSALGESSDQIRQSLTMQSQTLTASKDYILEKQVWVGAYQSALVDSVPDHLKYLDSRNLRFALTALQKIEAQVKAYTSQFETQHLAIVLGTSTSGISTNEPLIQQHFLNQSTKLIGHEKQEMGSLAKSIQSYLGWKGPAYTISTACSSSAKAMAAGQRLIHAGLADAVLVGGVDTLCKLTLNGFNSLESLSDDICRPCGFKRDGINIGEAAALFLISKETAPVMLLSAGESMDAWHISAPHPEGRGAAEAMQKALDTANLNATDIHYLNLHGTSTPQNDAMEINAVRTVFKDYDVPLSSTKHKTGHCLGAAGAIEALICHQVLLDQSWLPLHHDGVIDSDLDDQNYILTSNHSQPIQYVMSNSFAFGGSNISLIFGLSK